MFYYSHLVLFVSPSFNVNTYLVRGKKEDRITFTTVVYLTVYEYKNGARLACLPPADFVTRDVSSGRMKCEK
jgi:hypothetical protein